MLIFTNVVELKDISVECGYLQEKYFLHNNHTLGKQKTSISKKLKDHSDHLK